MIFLDFKFSAVKTPWWVLNSKGTYAVKSVSFHLLFSFYSTIKCECSYLFRSFVQRYIVKRCFWFLHTRIGNVRTICSWYWRHPYRHNKVMSFAFMRTLFSWKICSVDYEWKEEKITNVDVFIYIDNRRYTDFKCVRQELSKLKATYPGESNLSCVIKYLRGISTT